MRRTGCVHALVFSKFKQGTNSLEAEGMALLHASYNVVMVQGLA